MSGTKKHSVNGTYIYKPVAVRAQKNGNVWQVQLPAGSAELDDEAFEKRFEHYSVIANREQRRHQLQTRVANQRREIRKLSRAFLALKSSYITLFGEIDRALGHDIPREQSASYQAGMKEGYSAGFAAGYDVAKGGNNE